MAQTAQVIQLDERRINVVETTPESGYIKAYRRLQEESFYQCPIRKSIWLHLLLNATHKPFVTKLGAKSVLLKPGQLITGRKQILQQCFDQRFVKVTEEHVRGALNFFKNEGMIEIETSRTGSIISIVKWAKYQGEKGDFEQCLTPQRIPQAIPQDEKAPKASNGAAYSEYEAEPIPNTIPDELPTKQEYNIKHSSSKYIGSSDDEPNEQKSSAQQSKKSPIDYPDEFEWIWKNRPRRAGSDPKSKALKACKARIKSGRTWRELAEGVKRYHAYCEATDKLDTEFTMQMATFFGPDEHFLNDFAIPEKPEAKFKRNLDWDDTSWGDNIDVVM